MRQLIQDDDLEPMVALHFRKSGELAVGFIAQSTANPQVLISESANFQIFKFICFRPPPYKNPPGSGTAVPKPLVQLK